VRQCACWIARRALSAGIDRENSSLPTHPPADIVANVPDLPEPGETTSTVGGSPLTRHAGGKGANQAAAAASLLEGTSRTAALVGRVGAAAGGGPDADAALPLAALAARGCDASLVVPVPGSSTGVALVLVSAATAENVVVVSGGAKLDSAAWAAARSDSDALESAESRAVGAASALLLQLEIPPAASLTAARACDGAVVLDLGGDAGLLAGLGGGPGGGGAAPAAADSNADATADPYDPNDPVSASRAALLTLLGRCDVVSPNETELAAVAVGLGLTTNGEGSDRGEDDDERRDETTARALLAWLERSGPARPPGARRRRVVVKRGAAGALSVRSGPVGTAPGEADAVRVVSVPAASPPGGVVDTTGAGDCFTAALAVALVEGGGFDPTRSDEWTDADEARALRWAALAAGIAVGRAGAMTSLPTRTEVDSAAATDAWRWGE